MPIKLFEPEDFRLRDAEVEIEKRKKEKDAADKKPDVCPLCNGKGEQTIGLITTTCYCQEIKQQS